MGEISLQYIADRLNVAKSTVSLVLNGRGDERRIGTDTQEKIIKFAKEHNYKVNQLARSLSIGKTNTIGLIVSNIADNFFGQIARRIEKKAEKFGYHVLFSSTGESAERESKIIQSMLDRKVDGLIIVSSEKNKEQILQLKKNNYPFVIVSRNYDDLDINSVVLDEIGGISSAVELLIKNGKRKIAFITISLDLQSIRERQIGYLQSMSKYNLEVKDNYVQIIDYEHVEKDMQKAIKKLVKGPDSVDGIVFATQYLTVAGIRVLKEINVSMPKELAIVSYGYKTDFDLFSPAISSVSLPIKELGDAAVDMLLDNLSGNRKGYKKIELKTELIVQESCGSQ